MIDDTQISTLQETLVSPADAAATPAQAINQAAGGDAPAQAPAAQGVEDVPADDAWGAPPQSLTATVVSPPPAEPLPAVAQESLPQTGVWDAPQEDAESPLSTQTAPAPATQTPPPPGTPVWDTPAPASGKAQETPAATAQKEAPQGVPGSTLEAAEKADFWESVLTGDPNTVPDSVRGQAGCNNLSLDADEQDYLLAQAINRSWLVDHRGLGREDVRSNWPVHRRKLAQELNVRNDEMDVFCGLSIMQRDMARREAARTIYKKAYLDGLLGKDYEDDTATLSTLDEEDRAAADALGVHSYQEGADVRARWMPLVKRTARGIGMFASMEEDSPISPAVFARVPDLVSTLDQLCDLKPEDQQLVIYLASELVRSRKGSGQGEGTGSRMGRAVKRSIGNIALDLTQAAENIGIDAINKLGGLVGGAKGSVLRREADAWDRRTRMAYNLRHIYQQELSPLYPAERSREIESYFIDAAEAVPSTILAFCGPGGFAGIAASGMGRSVAEARARAPQGDIGNQIRAGITAGAIQAGIFMGMTRVGGKMMENTISNFMKSRGAGAAAFSMNGLKAGGAVAFQGASLLAAGKLSQGADLGAHEISARLSGTASNIDWKSYGESITDVEANMHEAAYLLPFLLIGSGRAALRHFRSPDVLLRNKEYLRKDWGIDDPTLKRIMEAPDIDTKGELLQKALSTSRRWSSPEFLDEARRAMTLLNSDYFTGFTDPELVRDFLKLPADVSHVEKPEPVTRTVQEMENLPYHTLTRSPVPLRPDALPFEDCIKVWDSWWQKSHIEKYVGPYFRPLADEAGYEGARGQRTYAYRSILSGETEAIPKRMHNSGIYAPRGEAERRALLRDTFQEIEDLSYQLIMCAFPMDTLMMGTYAVERAEKQAERSRKGLLAHMSSAVLSMALGTPSSIAINELRCRIGDYVDRRSFAANAPDWMLEARYDGIVLLVPPNEDSEHFKWGAHDDYREVLRIMDGMSACCYRLANLIPMSSDFATALTRGMSPAQAYQHLLVREFGYDPEKAFSYPLQEIKNASNVTDMERFNEETRRSYGLSLALTGRGLEQATGANHGRYWRALRPDGYFTRWHDNGQAAMNDLAMAVAPYFSPMGDKYFRWLRFFKHRRNKFDLADRPTASYKEFCGFDQLAGIATRDYRTHFINNPTRTTPGLVLQRLRKRLGGHKSLDPVRVQTQKDPSRDPGGEVVVDSLSTLTPFNLCQARLRAHWKRMLDSGFIPAEKVVDFLEGRGLLTPERRVQLEEMATPLRFPKNPDTPLCETPPPDISGRNGILSDYMSEYHALRTFADLENHEMPPSVLQWFRMVPFCPSLPEDQYVSPVSRYVSRRIPFGPGGRTALAWSNRMTAMKLNSLAGEIERMRQEISTNPLPENGIAEMFRMADEVPEAQRYEQGWCFLTGGHGVFRSTPQYMWNLLQSPLRTWESMGETARNDLREHIEYVAMTDPVTSALDAAGRGEQVDYVEHSIRNLDAALQRHPQLHSYAAVRGSATQAYMLEPNDDMPWDPAVESPELELFSVDFDDTISNDRLSQHLVDLPADIKEDPDAMQALQFLDILRATSTHRPYMADNMIWWNKTPYGGLRGKCPVGTSHWELSDPVANVFRILNNIHEINKAPNSGGFDICGVHLEGSPLTLEDFEDLHAVSVYRYPQNRTRVYRLMPGFPQSSNISVRTPYMVLCHRGLYVSDDHKLIHNPTDIYRSYVPLEKYTRKGFPDFVAQQLPEWRRGVFIHTLDALGLWPKYADKLMADEHSGVHGLSELLLRLCEDSGFTVALDPENPENLSVEDAHLLNVAHAILGCMQEPHSEDARRSLARAMKPLAEGTEMREAVLDALCTYNDVVLKKKARMDAAAEAAKRDPAYITATLFEEALERNIVRSQVGVLVSENVLDVPLVKRPVGHPTRRSKESEDQLLTMGFNRYALGEVPPGWRRVGRQDPAPDPANQGRRRRQGQDQPELPPDSNPDAAFGDPPGGDGDLTAAESEDE